jgi:hypothetical protein
MSFIEYNIMKQMSIGNVERIARAGDAGPGSLERRRRESPYTSMISQWKIFA